MFDAVDTLRLCLTPFIPMLKTMRVLKENMRAAAAKGFINATDCADYLVASKGLPFRDAYKITGELVALCIERGLTLETLPIDEYKKVCNAFDGGVYEAINLEKCVRDRKVKGAPCPENVPRGGKRSAHDRKRAINSILPLLGVSKWKRLRSASWAPPVMRARRSAA